MKWGPERTIIANLRIELILENFQLIRIVTYRTGKNVMELERLEIKSKPLATGARTYPDGIGFVYSVHPHDEQFDELFSRIQIVKYSDEKEFVPIPVMDEFTYFLGGAGVFYTFHATSCYLNVQIEETNRLQTNLPCHLRLNRIVQLPSGMKITSVIF